MIISSKFLTFCSYSSLFLAVNVLMRLESGVCANVCLSGVDSAVRSGRSRPADVHP